MQGITQPDQSTPARPVVLVRLQLAGGEKLPRNRYCREGKTWDGSSNGTVQTWYTRNMGVCASFTRAEWIVILILARWGVTSLFKSLGL